MLARVCDVRSGVVCRFAHLLGNKENIGTHICSSVCASSRCDKSVYHKHKSGSASAPNISTVKIHIFVCRISLSSGKNTGSLAAISQQVSVQMRLKKTLQISKVYWMRIKELIMPRLSLITILLGTSCMRTLICLLAGLWTLLGG